MQALAQQRHGRIELPCCSSTSGSGSSRRRATIPYSALMAALVAATLAGLSVG